MITFPNLRFVLQSFAELIVEKIHDERLMLVYFGIALFIVGLLILIGAYKIFWVHTEKSRDTGLRIIHIAMWAAAVQVFLFTVAIVVVGLTS